VSGISKGHFSESDNGNLISSISSMLRQNILGQLLKSSKTLAEIARINNISATDAHRNIKKLDESKLVRKNHNGLIEITTGGKCIVKILPFFISISKHNVYFNNHDLEFLSLSASQKLGLLADCSVIDDTVNVFEKLRDIIKNADEFHFVAAAQVSPELAEYKLNTKPDLYTKAIIGDNSIIPSRVHVIIKKHFENSSFLKNYFLKKVKHLDFFLCMSEKEAGILFYDLNKNMNMNSLLYGDTPEFLQWCKELFENEWSKGKDMAMEELF
jgi:predicted transcriptional regulator